MSKLTNNTTKLELILDKVRNLPEPGIVPTGTREEYFSGTQSFDVTNFATFIGHAVNSLVGEETITDLSQVTEPGVLYYFDGKMYMFGAQIDQESNVYPKAVECMIFTDANGGDVLIPVKALPQGTETIWFSGEYVVSQSYLEELSQYEEVIFKSADWYNFETVDTLPEGSDIQPHTVYTCNDTDYIAYEVGEVGGMTYKLAPAIVISGPNGGDCWVPNVPQPEGTLTVSAIKESNQVIDVTNYAEVDIQPMFYSFDYEEVTEIPTSGLGENVIYTTPDGKTYMKSFNGPLDSQGHYQDILEAPVECAILADVYGSDAAIPCINTDGEKEVYPLANSEFVEDVSNNTSIKIFAVNSIVEHVVADILPTPSFDYAGVIYEVDGQSYVISARRNESTTAVGQVGEPEWLPCEIWQDSNGGDFILPINKHSGEHLETFSDTYTLNVSDIVHFEKITLISADYYTFKTVNTLPTGDNIEPHTIYSYGGQQYIAYAVNNDPFEFKLAYAHVVINPKGGDCYVPVVPPESFVFKYEDVNYPGENWDYGTIEVTSDGKTYMPAYAGDPQYHWTATTQCEIMNDVDGNEIAVPYLPNTYVKEKDISELEMGCDGAIYYGSDGTPYMRAYTDFGWPIAVPATWGVTEEGYDAVVPYLKTDTVIDNDGYYDVSGDAYVTVTVPKPEVKYVDIYEASTATITAQNTLYTDSDGQGWMYARTSSGDNSYIKANLECDEYGWDALVPEVEDLTDEINDYTQKVADLEQIVTDLETELANKTAGNINGAIVRYESITEASTATITEPNVCYMTPDGQQYMFAIFADGNPNFVPCMVYADSNGYDVLVPVINWTTAAVEQTSVANLENSTASEVEG